MTQDGSNFTGAGECGRSQCEQGRTLRKRLPEGHNAGGVCGAAALARGICRRAGAAAPHNRTSGQHGQGMGAVGWIDFSSDDRRRVQDVLALAKEAGTLDELGIGQLRDAYAEALFPGFSTIQTRARYFLAIPKILCDWRDQSPAQRRRQRLEDYLAAQETSLAWHLTRNHARKRLSPEGIIGHTLVERGGVKRPPSTAYWAGLRVFGLVRTTKSLGEFLRR